MLQWGNCDSAFRCRDRDLQRFFVTERMGFTAYTQIRSVVVLCKQIRTLHNASAFVHQSLLLEVIISC